MVQGPVLGLLTEAMLLCLSSDYMRQGQDAPEKQHERYVYDPTAGAQPDIAFSSL